MSGPIPRAEAGGRPRARVRGTGRALAPRPPSRRLRTGAGARGRGARLPGLFQSRCASDRRGIGSGRPWPGGQRCGAGRPAEGGAGHASERVRGRGNARLGNVFLLWTRTFEWGAVLTAFVSVLSVCFIELLSFHNCILPEDQDLAPGWSCRGHPLPCGGGDWGLIRQVAPSRALSEWGRMRTKVLCLAVVPVWPTSCTQNGGKSMRCSFPRGSLPFPCGACGAGGVPRVGGASVCDPDRRRSPPQTRYEREIDSGLIRTKKGRGRTPAACVGGAARASGGCHR